MYEDDESEFEEDHRRRQAQIRREEEEAENYRCPGGCSCGYSCVKLGYHFHCECGDRGDGCYNRRLALEAQARKKASPFKR